jgi:acetyltransferase
MSTYRLDKLFAPRSVALIGGSPRPDSLGRIALRNLLDAGFAGPVRLVNPNHAEVEGVATVPRIADLPETPDLVVVTTPPAIVPALIAEAAARGSAAAVIITAGLGHGPGSLAAAAEQAARAHGMRLVGPNCLGVFAPGNKLNASFAARAPRPGDLAFLSQSGALVAAILEWAARRAVGFSGIVSLGDKVDVDFGDLLDYFALDRTTRAILLYIESIKDARKFMSAARAAARAKPVVVIKAGRHVQGAKAAATHTGALAGSDAVYDAAFRRAGLLRVFDLDELFDAAQTLGMLRPFAGKRLAVLTNGGGLGVLAVDRLADFGGTLATLAPETMQRLDRVLPPTWSRANPIDIVGDADAARYGAALDALLADAASDAVLVMNVPTAMAAPLDAASKVAEVAQKRRSAAYPPKPLLAVWTGEDEAVARTFEQARIPQYPTEADAVRGFMHLVRYREAQDALMETPPSLPQDFAPDVEAGRRAVAQALADGRTWLDPLEAAALLQAYAIPLTPVVLAGDPDAATRAAKPFLANCGAAAVKIFSHDIVHKSEVDGVRLDLRSEQAVREAAADVIARARRLKPTARIAGVTVHPMIDRPRARELIAGLADDPTFGPVIVFGHGGVAVEVIDDKALALPPLDLRLARELIGRTRVAKLLNAYRNVPAANQAEVALVLVKLAQLAADLPEVREIDINPLLADADGALALDARIAVAPVGAKFKGPGHPRFAVRPYPKQWERRLKVNERLSVLARPVRPEDEPLFLEFFKKVTPADLRLRYFAPVKDIGHAFVARLTQLDYARAMAFVALDEKTGEALGAVRIHADADYQTGEYAILVRSDLKGRGLGWTLMRFMIEYARSEGLKRIEGEVLAENMAMLQMCEQLGFRVTAEPDDPGIRIVRLSLDGSAQA